MNGKILVFENGRKQNWLSHLSISTKHKAKEQVQKINNNKIHSHNLCVLDSMRLGV